MNSLGNCSGDGLVVGAKGITIDMHHHRISGADKTKFFNGIRDDENLNAGFDDVTIRNGVVDTFSDNVDVNKSNGVTVSGVHTLHAGNFGIFYEECVQCVLRGNRVTDDVNHGIILENSSHATLAGNVSASAHSAGIVFTQFDDHSVVTHNLAIADGFGIDLIKSGELTVVGNRAIGSTLAGVLFTEGVEKSAIEKNASIGNGGEGFLFDDFVQHDQVTGNTASGNETIGFSLLNVSMNRFSFDVARANSGDGFKVSGGSKNSFISDAWNENGTNGFESDTNAVTVAQNAANRNGFLGGPPGDGMGLGLLIPAGSVNHGNIARHNDDPHECQASDVNCFVP